MNRPEKLKVKCPNCKNEIIILRNTNSCPKCSINFERESIQSIFDDYETKLANNKTHQLSEKIGKTSSGLKNISQFTSELGCTLMLLPIGIISLIFLLQMCSK